MPPSRDISTNRHKVHCALPHLLSDADKFLSLRTQVFHDVLVEVVRSERINCPDEDGRLKSSKELLKLIREFKFLVLGRQSVDSITWTDVAAEKFLEALTSVGTNRELDLICAAAVCIRWAEQLRKRKERK